MEASFIKRGRAFVETLYPDPQQRRRLYQYGFTPYIGRRFELVAPQLIAELQAAIDYGTWTAEQRFALLIQLGERMRAEPGIGFRVRDTVGDQAVLANWRRAPSRLAKVCHREYRIQARRCGRRRGGTGLGAERRG
jgi:hypothetical protein